MTRSSSSTDGNDGPMMHAPRWWKRMAREKLRASMFKTQMRLAKHLGISQVAISGALGPSQKASRYVIAISNALRIPVPIGDDDREYADAYRKLRRLTSKELAALVVVADAFLAARPEPDVEPELPPDDDDDAEDDEE
jgi:hypothetical protein